MILEIDAGNTRLKWRLDQNGEIVSRGQALTADILQGQPLNLDNSRRLSKARLCSVAGARVDSILTEQLQSTCENTVWIASVTNSACGVRCGYQAIGALGVDRWAAVVASYHRVKGAAIVVDAGSALTIDLVDSSGQHLGGYIVPGQRLMHEALWRGTHAVKVEHNAAESMLTPGDSTSDAVSKGTLLMISSMIERLAVLYPGEIILTGGDADLIQVALTVKTRVIPELVLDGLRLLAEENKA